MSAGTTARAKAAAADTASGIVGLFFAFLPIVASLCIPAWQGYQFLRGGRWLAVSTIDILAAVGFRGWVVEPSDWRGIWRLLDLVPAWMSLFGLGCTGWWLANEIAEGAKSKPN